MMRRSVLSFRTASRAAAIGALVIAGWSYMDRGTAHAQGPEEFCGSVVIAINGAFLDVPVPCVPAAPTTTTTDNSPVQSIVVLDNQLTPPGTAGTAP